MKLNSKKRRAMLHNGAMKETRARFTAETPRLLAQISRIERTNAFHRSSLNYGKPHLVADINDVKMYAVPSTSNKTLTSRITSASIPDSFVARTDNTDKLFRARDTRSFYSKRDRLVNAGVRATQAPIIPAKVLSWAKSRGIL